jgi:hypothetical protein
MFSRLTVIAMPLGIGFDLFDIADASARADLSAASRVVYGAHLREDLLDPYLFNNLCD